VEKNEIKPPPPLKDTIPLPLLYTLHYVSSSFVVSEKSIAEHAYEVLVLLHFKANMPLGLGSDVEFVLGLAWG